MLKDFLDKIPYMALFTGLINSAPWSSFDGSAAFSAQRRFSWLMHLNRSVLFKKPKVLGSKNLSKIPKLPLIIVASHFSDADLQVVASELGPRLKKVRPGRFLGMSLQSENLADFKSALIIRAIGREYFFEIDARFDKKTKRLDFTFNLENFKKMAKGLLGGTDIIIAAHEPLSNIPGLPWELPARAGLGAAYLAQMANAVLLPVAVDIQTTCPVGMSADFFRGAAKRLIKKERPQVKVVIGQPFTLNGIGRAELEILGRRISHLGIAREDEARAEKAFDMLKKQSGRVMEAVAVLLPEKKRGRWKD